MNYQKLLDELFSKQSGAIKLDLVRIRRLSKALGNPEKKLKAIHVGGSNGKGSSCAFIFSILREQGYSVGFYSSPHLKKFNERIKVDNSSISDRDVSRLYGIIRPHVSDETFFEITTLMAFLYFAEKKCDYVVIEVGLGGRLDATNIIAPLVCAITTISLEHTHILGKTIGKIASEKAGIIKEGVPIVCGVRGGGLNVIKRKAKMMGAPFIVPSEVIRRGAIFSVGNHKNLRFGKLRGEYQYQNAALAITALDALRTYHGAKIDESAIRRGIKNAEWRGRLEWKGKHLLIDCAHNEEGAIALLGALKSIKKKKILLLGILEDKDIKKMVKILDSQAESFVFTRVPNERSADPKKLAGCTKKPFEIVDDPKKALERAIRLAGKKNIVVASGSIYLVGTYL